MSNLIFLSVYYVMPENKIGLYNSLNININYMFSKKVIQSNATE